MESNRMRDAQQVELAAQIGSSSSLMTPNASYSAPIAYVWSPNKAVISDSQVTTTFETLEIVCAHARNWHTEDGNE